MQHPRSLALFAHITRSTPLQRRYLVSQPQTPCWHDLQHEATLRVEALASLPSKSTAAPPLRRAGRLTMTIRGGVLLASVDIGARHRSPQAAYAWLDLPGLRQQGSLTRCTLHRRRLPCSTHHHHTSELQEYREELQQRLQGSERRQLLRAPVE